MGLGNEISVLRLRNPCGGFEGRAAAVIAELSVLFVMLTSVPLADIGSNGICGLYKLLAHRVFREVIPILND